MNPQNPNSPEDRLLDELLREQTRGPDEAFLQQIESAIDAGPPQVAKSPPVRRYGRLTIAAGVGLVAGVSFFLHLESRSSKNHTVAARGSDAAAEKEKAALASQKPDQEIRDQEAKVEESRKELAAVVRARGIIYRGTESSYQNSGPSGVNEDRGAAIATDVASNDARAEEISREPAAPAAAGLPLLPALADASAAISGENSGPEAELHNLGQSDVTSATKLTPASEEFLRSVNRRQEIRLRIVPALKDPTDALENSETRPSMVPPTKENSPGDQYGTFIEQPWKSPAQDPLSTFSIDVDTASYSNVRRMIREGREIPKDAVRIEECINAFRYAYAQPQGDAPFAVGATLAVCPWAPDHQLVRVAIKGREIEATKRPASNLVFLIDVSGSMQSPDKLPLLKQSMQTLVDQLDERDRVAIVVYAGSEGVALDSTRLDAAGKAAVTRALAKLEAGGSTNGGAGIDRAYKLAMEQKIEDGVNRVILATDGDFNVGVTGREALVDLVKSRAKGGVFLTVAGFGTGNLNDAMMDAITRDGNGNYFYIDSEREGRKVFLQNLSGTLVTIAKDVKIQVEFNPAKVGGYRLIGYANRVLRNEDFNNDKVDAGDIGAGHTVTAFYELAAPGSAAATDPLKYRATAEKPAAVPATDEWLTVKLRHKHPDGDESRKIEFPLTGTPATADQTDADFQFATAVALFGMKLRGMDEVREVSWKRVLELARPGLANDANEDRAEFVGLVEKLRNTTEVATFRKQVEESIAAPSVRELNHPDGSRSVFTRAPDRKKITKQRFSATGALTLTAIYKTDDQGNPQSCRIVDADNVEIFKVSYGYDKFTGKLAEELMFDSRVKRMDPDSAKEVPVQKVVYSYDPAGKRSQPEIHSNLPGRNFAQTFGQQSTALTPDLFNPAGEAEVMPEHRDR